MQSCIHETIVLLGASSAASVSLKTRSTISLISCGDSDIMSSKADLGSSPSPVDARDFFPNLTSICPENIGWEGGAYRISSGGSRGGRGTCFVIEVLPVSLLSVVMA